MKEHTIIYGQGAQNLRTYLVDGNGEAKRPSSVTGEIVDPTFDEDDTGTDRVVLAATAATVDSYSEATTAIAGSGQSDPSAITVASDTGAAEGRVYRIEAPAGHSEAFTVDHIDASSNVLYAAESLRRAYPIGSTVEGIEFELEFPATTANDEPRFDADLPFIVKWVAVGVDPARSREPIRIRRFQETFYGTLDDVLLVDQDLDELTGRRLRIERALKLANVDFRREVRRRGVDPELFIAGDIGRDYVMYRAAAIMRRQMGGDTGVDLAVHYDERAMHVLLGLKSEGSIVTTHAGDKLDKQPDNLRNFFRLT